MSDPYAAFDALTFDRPSPGVLRITLDIDGIARQVETSCFRPDGSLAFLFTTLTAPLAEAPGGPESGRSPACRSTSGCAGATVRSSSGPAA